LRTTSHITDGSARLATLHQRSVDQTALETDDIGKKKLHYLVDNHLGSVSLELDEAGDVISYEEYFPFGGTSFIAGRNAREVKLKEYRYSGKCRDDATGFYCYEYRYYAPFIVGWLSPDPLGPVDGLNLYRFVHNNPIRFVDADGLNTSEAPLDPDYTIRMPEEFEGLRTDPDPRSGQRLNKQRVISSTSGHTGLRVEVQGNVYLLPGEFVWHATGEWIFQVTGEFESFGASRRRC
jgi:RHS repeat-associated protein